MNRLFAILIWAGRDVRREPFSVLLTSIAIALLIGITGLITLTTHALQSTAEEVLANGPALVIRRLNQGGWDTMPKSANARVQKITGVTDVTLRVFGTVSSPSGPLTLVGRPSHSISPLIGSPLKEGEAVIGPGVTAMSKNTITVEAMTKHTLKVVHQWTKASAPVTHDLVVTTPSTARTILGIPPGHGSDLAVFVFHDGEAKAIASDLQKALPFPVQITTRDEAVGKTAVLLGKRATLSFSLFLPSLIGLVLLIAATIKERRSSKKEMGLLKALGWTTSDVFVFHLSRALLLGIPGAVIGVTGALVFTVTPGISWPLKLLYGWEESIPPGLTLSSSGILMGLAMISGAVLVPWITAAVIPSLSKSTEDPAEVLKGG